MRTNPFPEQGPSLTINSYVWVINRPEDRVAHVLMTTVRHVLRYIAGSCRYILDGFPDQVFEASDLYDYSEYQTALNDLNDQLETEAGEQDTNVPNRVQLYIDKRDLDQIKDCAETILNPVIRFGFDEKVMMKQVMDQIRTEAERILDILKR